MHSISKMGLVALMLASAPAAKAQLYGASPFSNGPTHFEGALYEFDPDTLVWLAGKRVFLDGFTVTGVNGLTVHPNLAPPLDENNVGRFCDIVREMSQRVPFIFITHNKSTMELASQLLGVTMNEPGVSRLVAVDVDEALRLAAS